MNRTIHLNLFLQLRMHYFHTSLHQQGVMLIHMKNFHTILILIKGSKRCLYINLSLTISYTVLNARYLIFLDILTILCQTYNDESPVLQFLPSFYY